MDHDNRYVDKEKDFQIERLANENERLKEELREKDEKVKRLERDLLAIIRRKNNLDGLKGVSKKNIAGAKTNEKGGKGKGVVDKNKGKVYAKCQRCGVKLVSPKPGQKFCVRHEKLNLKLGKNAGDSGGYKYIKVYQGGSPGGGKKR